MVRSLTDFTFNLYISNPDRLLMTFDRFTPNPYFNLSSFLPTKKKALGTILQEADLVSPYQIQSALQDQVAHPNLKIGEILVQRDLIKPETADFFVQDWSNVMMQPNKNALGYYLRRAAILNSGQIEVILAVQRDSGIRFGTIAVFQGFLKSTTLDFFLTNLFPEELHVSPFINMNSRRKT